MTLWMIWYVCVCVCVCVCVYECLCIKVGRKGDGEHQKMHITHLHIHTHTHTQMAAGLDTRELYRVAVSYKSKLGPFATPRILNEYLKAVFRAPDLSSQFVEAMDTVVNQLLKVKDQELVDAIAEIAREVCMCVCVCMCLFLHIFLLHSHSCSFSLSNHSHSHTHTHTHIPTHQPTDGQRTGIRGHVHPPLCL